MNGRILTSAAIALVLLPLRLALSHHGFFGEYALDDRVEFTGTVTAVEWVNPHAFVRVRTEIGGESLVVGIELASPTQLARRGWQGRELAVGTTVRVSNGAWSLQDGARLICCARIYDLEGREYFTNPRTGGEEQESPLAQRPPAD